MQKIKMAYMLLCQSGFRQGLALISNEVHTSISQLKLANFRNYQSCNFNFNNKIIAISGDNGVGKTNILEAISLLSRGQGLKNAEFEEMIFHQQDNTKSYHACASQESENQRFWGYQYPTKDGNCHNNIVDNDFAIFANLQNHPNIDNIGTSYSLSEKKRAFQINNQILKSNSKNKTFPTLIWLTPQLDNLFCFSKTIRRKFFDKIVSDINDDHSNIINLYNHSLRERLNLLYRFDSKKNSWLDIIEQKIAELAIIIASARNEAIKYLNQSIRQNDHNFTKATIKIVGEIEEMAKDQKAIEVEGQIMQKLKNNRDLDKKSGRTNFGVHRSDFVAILDDKQIEAKFCSTGEQKSILIALTFARIKIFPLLNLPSAILLLDEIVSHLDDKKRADLLEELTRLNCQSFLTATHKRFFSNLECSSHNIAQFIELSQDLR